MGSWKQGSLELWSQERSTRPSGYNLGSPASAWTPLGRGAHSQMRASVWQVRRSGGQAGAVGEVGTLQVLGI